MLISTPNSRPQKFLLTCICENYAGLVIVVIVPLKWSKYSGLSMAAWDRLIVSFKKAIASKGGKGGGSGPSPPPPFHQKWSERQPRGSIFQISLNTTTFEILPPPFRNPLTALDCKGINYSTDPLTITSWAKHIWSFKYYNRKRTKQKPFHLKASIRTKQKPFHLKASIAEWNFSSNGKFH